MEKNRTEALAQSFSANAAIYWANLARVAGLLVVLNVSFFFLTELVKMGYYFTYFSLGCLGAVYLCLLVPTTWTRRLWFYGVALVFLAVAVYFLVVSISYWVKMGSSTVGMPGG